MYANNDSVNDIYLETKFKKTKLKVKDKHK